MGKECIVMGCTNRDSKKMTGIKFHRLPADAERRQKWLIAVNRKEEGTDRLWIPNDPGCRICSEHFISGKNDNPTHPDYVPSVKMGYSSTKVVTPIQQLIRFQRASGRESAKRRLQLQDENRMTAAQALLDISNIREPNMDPPKSEPEPPVCVHQTCIKIIAELRVQNKQLCAEVTRLEERIDQLETDREATKDRFSAADIKDSDEKTTFFTGLPSYASFVWCSTLVSSCLPNSEFLTHMVLLILMRLRVNIPNQCLAYLFHISTGFVSEIVNSGLVEMAKKVSFLMRWPEKDEILRTMPACFTRNLRRYVSIIDCTEVYIETPSNFTARASTYSNYKHFNTLKFLIKHNTMWSSVICFESVWRTFF